MRCMMRVGLVEVLKLAAVIQEVGMVMEAGSIDCCLERSIVMAVAAESCVHYPSGQTVGHSIFLFFLGRNRRDDDVLDVCVCCALQMLLHHGVSTLILSLGLDDSDVDEKSPERRRGRWALSHRRALSGPRDLHQGCVVFHHCCC